MTAPAAVVRNAECGRRTGMSHYDYQISKHIAAEDYPFFALIMAAMRQADTDNLEKLRSMFPKVYQELVERYSAPGGILDTDPGGHA